MGSGGILFCAATVFSFDTKNLSLEFLLWQQETDYNLTYFDNGENYGADEDDDLDEGPVY